MLDNTTGRVAARIERSGPAGSRTWRLELYSYDSEGRIKEKTVRSKSSGADDFEITYAYDRQDRLTSRTVHVDGQSFTLSYTYNDRGLLSSISAGNDLFGDYSYHADGSVTMLRTDPTSYNYYFYDVQGRLTAINYPEAENPNNFSAALSYDDDGNVIESVYHQPDSPTSHPHYRYQYSYDSSGRLVGADYSFATWDDGGDLTLAAAVPGDGSDAGWKWYSSSAYDVTGIQYDGAGNLLYLHRRSNTGSSLDDLNYTYAAGTNRLTGIMDAAGNQEWAAADEALGYDASGNLLSMSGRGLSFSHYDAANLPLQITDDGVTITHRYASGYRYWRSAGSTSTHWVLDGATPLAVQTNGSLDYFLVVLPDGEAIGRITPSGATFGYIKDHLGSVRMVEKQGTGTVTVHDYYPFGLQMNGRSDVTYSTREGFTGKERDDVTDLDYFGARLYNSALGIWTSVDPLADNYPAYSPYNYVLGDPLGLVDPDGRAPTDWYRRADGSVAFDARIQSQADLDRRLIDGSYIGDSFVARTASGRQLSFNEMGTITESYVLPGATVSPRSSSTAKKASLAMSGLGFAAEAQNATIARALSEVPAAGTAANILGRATNYASIGLTVGAAFTSIQSQYSTAGRVGIRGHANVAADVILGAVGYGGGWMGAGVAFGLDASGAKDAAVDGYVNWRMKGERQNILDDVQDIEGGW